MKPKVERLTLNMAELEAIVEHTRSGPLSEEQHRQLKAVIATLGYLTQELENKRTSITRLRPQGSPRFISMFARDADGCNQEADKWATRKT